jgi:iron complex transport system substrate-binding protein
VLRGLWGLLFLVLLIKLAPADAAPLEVRDDSGRSVHLALPAQRIVSLAPHATELVFAVGAGAELVAVSAFSDYPAGAQSLPQVGGAQGIDLERIARLRPDLVIAWTSGNSPQELEAIERLGIPVFRSDPHSLEAVAENLEELGVLTGHAPTGAQAAANFRARIAALRRRYQGRARVKVFYQVWNKPLMTVGGTHLISHVIELCGGQNIFGDLDALAPTVDAEAVITRDPEVIAVASDLGRGSEELALWQEWPRLAAVARHHFVILDPALITRPTPRIADGASLLCEDLERARHDQ